MANIRFHLAVIAAKLTAKLIHMLGRKGSHTPGVVALKLCPDFLARMPRAPLTICVTGTNGKTTVSNMLCDALIESGRKTVSNRAGSNIVPGCVANGVNALNWMGKCVVDATVYETDERASRLILPYIKPDYLVVTNLSRDTLKRNAHTDYIFSVIDTYCPETTKLILNADDTCSSQLRPGNERVFFGIGKQPEDVTEPYNIIADNILCPKCAARLRYDYLRYNHIGHARCPECGFESYNADYLATEIDREGGKLTVSVKGEQRELNLIHDLTHNIYNEMAILAVLNEIGTPAEDVARILGAIKLPSIRFEEITVGEKTLVMSMGKGQNSVSVSRNFEFVANSPEEKTVILDMDDPFDRKKSVEYMGWIWDVEYEQLVRENIRQILVTGPRCYDHMARLVVAGVPEEKILCVMDEMEAMDHVLLEGVEKIYLIFDCTTLDLANKMKQKLLGIMEGKK